MGCNCGKTPRERPSTTSTSTPPAPKGVTPAAPPAEVSTNG
jgi:hypothetical protein